MLTALARVVDAVERRSLGTATQEEIDAFRREFQPVWQRLNALVDDERTPQKQKDTAYVFFNKKVRKFLDLHPNFHPYRDGRMFEDNI